MLRRILGRTGIEVSAVGVGTWRTFDTDEDRRPLVEEALAAGIDLFDSSPMYGRAEDVLARALEGLRGGVKVATKVWTEDPEKGINQAAHALALYGHVDVYQVHNLVNVPVQLAMLEALKTEGRVRAIGATHYLESAFPDLVEVMKTGRLDMIQIPYNPLRRQVEKTILPLAEELGIGIFVMSPLQGGILDRRPSPGQLAELGVQTWAQAVIRWIVSDQRVTSVLTATRQPGRITENAAGGSAPLFSSEQRQLVVEIAAGDGSPPGGQ